MPPSVHINILVPTVCVKVEALVERSDCELQEARLSCQKRERSWLLQRSGGSGDVVLVARRMGVSRFVPLQHLCVV